MKFQWFVALIVETLLQAERLLEQSSVAQRLAQNTVFGAERAA